MAELLTSTKTRLVCKSSELVTWPEAGVLAGTCLTRQESGAHTCRRGTKAQVAFRAFSAQEVWTFPGQGTAPPAGGGFPALHPHGAKSTPPAVTSKTAPDILYVGGQTAPKRKAQLHQAGGGGCEKVAPGTPDEGESALAAHCWQSATQG